MCGRSSLTLNEKDLEKKFGISFYSDDVNRYNPIPNFNIAPTHFVPIITNRDKNHFQYFKWGLIPSWAKDEKIGSRLINARTETVESKSSFKSSFNKRKCLIPMSGYYEWMRKSGKKHVYRIIMKDTEVFFAAGIWNTWKDNNGNKIPTYSVLTRDAQEKISYIHDRMPAILTPGEETEWLEEDLSTAEAKDLIYKLDDDLISGYPVSYNVNSVKNNDESLIEEVDPPEVQQTLF